MEVHVPVVWSGPPEWVLEPLVPIVLADVEWLEGPGPAVRIEVDVDVVAADAYHARQEAAEAKGEALSVGEGRYSGPGSLFCAQQVALLNKVFDNPERTLRWMREQAWDAATPRWRDEDPHRHGRVRRLLVRRSEGGTTHAFARVSVPWQQDSIAVRLQLVSYRHCGAIETRAHRCSATVGGSSPVAESS